MSDNATADAAGGGDFGGPRDDARTPVRFWNGVALDLVALDHSVAAADARAIGPVATARALGLVHAVVADAVRLARPREARWEPFRGNVGADGAIGEPDFFVGGAAAAILRHIYGNAPHLALIDRRQAAFLRLRGRDDRGDFRRGVAFGSDDAYRREWNWPELFRLLDPADTTYRPSPGRHDVDPFNPGQGFYGQRWGEAPPFVLTRDEIAAPGVAPPEPPPTGSERYEQSLADVRARGVLHGTPQDPQRTREQEDVGLFWAYDGARLIGTPPRLYNQILVEVARRDLVSDVGLARLLALCNLAMADAGIVAWRAKYTHAVWRPVLGIRNDEGADLADRDWRPLGAPRTNRPDFGNRPGPGAGPALEADAAFAQSLPPDGGGAGGGGVVTAQSLLGGNPGGGGAGGAQPQQASPDPAYSAAAFTPNFPAYPSGHATFGAACFDVLRRVRAEDGPAQREPNSLRREPFVSDELNGRSLDNFRDERRPFRPQGFGSIEEIINLNSESRVWLGVHWEFDAEGGVASGRAVGDAVYGRALRRT